MVVLKTEDLCKSYSLGNREIPVLHNITFSVKKGDFAAIMGPSGSGKTTLLNILGCLDSPTTGKYILNNKSVSEMSENMMAQIRNHDIGFVFQNFNLLPKLDIYSNVELPLIYGNYKKTERKNKVVKILEMLGLKERMYHRPNEISGGQKQRVAIARALVKDPAIILADEPTGNLDSHTTQEIMDLLKKLHKQGNTILMITHEKDVALCAQNVYKLSDGKLS